MKAFKKIIAMVFSLLFIIPLGAQKIDFYALKMDGSDPNGSEAEVTITVFRNGSETIATKMETLTVGPIGFFQVDMTSELDNVDINGNDALSYMVKVVIDGETIESNIVPWRHGLQSLVARRAGIADMAGESELAKVADRLANTLEASEPDQSFLILSLNIDAGIKNNIIPFNDPTGPSNMRIFGSTEDYSVVPDEFRNAMDNLAPGNYNIEVNAQGNYMANPTPDIPTMNGFYAIEVTDSLSAYKERPILNLQLPVNDGFYLINKIADNLAWESHPLISSNLPVEEGNYSIDFTNSTWSYQQPPIINIPVPEEDGQYTLNIDGGNLSYQTNSILNTPSDPGDYAININMDGNVTFAPSNLFGTPDPNAFGVYGLQFDPETNNYRYFPAGSLGSPPVSQHPLDAQYEEVQTFEELEDLVNDPLNINFNALYRVVETGRIYKPEFCPSLLTHVFDEIAPITQPFFRSPGGMNNRILDSDFGSSTTINGTTKLLGELSEALHNFHDGMNNYAGMFTGNVCANDIQIGFTGISEDPIVKSGNSINGIRSLWDNTKSGKEESFGERLERVFPSLIREVDYTEVNGGGIQKTIRINNLAPIISKAIAEQQQIIEKQQEEIDELKELVKKLIEEKD